MSLALKKSAVSLKPAGPVVLCIMDGIGYSKNPAGDAYAAAYKPNLDWLHANCPHRAILAHGTAVGLPSDDDMGNSEVGHNAIGGGRVVAQGAKLVNHAIASGEMFQGHTWNQLMTQVSGGSTLHFLGLFSDGNVHAHLDHLKAMINQAVKEGVKKIRIHALLDGRDVGETTALDYVLPFEDFMAGVRKQGCDIRIASGGGRMFLTMDRYNADWSMVERGWNTHVLGLGRQFKSAAEAIETFRSEAKVIDQNLPAFVIAENGKPVGTVEDGDAVIFYNFRGDRSIEISRAFDEDSFPFFDRKRRPKVMYAGMMEYDGDLHIPKHYLVNPPAISKPLSEWLCANGVRQYAISETQKYGHVTYFFNGNRSGKFNETLETFVEIPSDVCSFDTRPWMKAVEITDATVEAIGSGKYDFIRLNYPNGDMVGHTGDYNAARISIEVMDIQIGRLTEAVKKAGGILIVTADHGNADEMYELEKNGQPKIDKATGKPKAKTSHTLNPVPFIVYNPSGKAVELCDCPKAGLANISSTVLKLLGYEKPEIYVDSIVK
ncbi:MAG: hypothetical protein RL095_136 [Verrucomicrobiota bacterium]|jgi:2,3-bisphosphoglycerate-independent phosphoglycerate mutase